jgi:hypothetical protein
MLDIRGITPLGGGATNRDLYVYVKTRNMPEKAEPKPPVDPDELGPDVRKRLGQVQLPRKGAIGKETADQLRQAIQSGRMTYDDAQAIMPTYIAYVWHDTGKTLGAGALLASQPSFGYLVWHDGDLNGWRYAFEGLNVTKVIPNAELYKVSVPDAGTAIVTTTIEAVEPGPIPEPTAQPEPGPDPVKEPPAKWWIWLLLALAVLIAMLVLLRKK